jgi:hypothetical protein
MTDPAGQYHELSVAEAMARSTNASLLDRFLEGFALSDKVLRHYASLMEQRSALALDNPCFVAHRSLLPRLADDLRGVWHLSGFGYWLQALTLSAAAVEIWATLGYIAWYKDRAAKWLSWQRSHATPWSVAAMIPGAIEAWNGPDEAFVTSMRRWYTFACMAKHANPSLQLRSLGAITAADHALASLPELYPNVHKAMFITLYSTLQLTYFTCGALFADDTGLPEDLLDAARDLSDAMVRIAKPR